MKIIVDVCSSLALFMAMLSVSSASGREGGREGGRGWGREGRDDCYTYYSDGTIYTDQQ